MCERALIAAVAAGETGASIRALQKCFFAYAVEKKSDPQ